MRVLRACHGVRFLGASTAIRRWLAGPCVACGRHGAAPLCDACMVASAIGPHASSAVLGGLPLRFAGAYHAPSAAGGGLSPLGLALVAFKDRGDRHAGRMLARLGADRCGALPAGADAIVPVPSDPSRLRNRGFSPAAWIAAALSRRSGVPVVANALRRLPGRPPQRGLGGTARRANARGAFSLGAARIRGYAVVLADDVSTTGATLREAAACLEHAGVRVLEAVVLACADEEVIRECRSRTGHAGTGSTGKPPG